MPLPNAQQIHDFSISLDTAYKNHDEAAFKQAAQRFLQAIGAGAYMATEDDHTHEAEFKNKQFINKAELESAEKSLKADFVSCAEREILHNIIQDLKNELREKGYIEKATSASTGHEIAQFHMTQEDELVTIRDQGRAAQRIWEEVPISGRKALIAKIHDKLLEHADAMKLAITLETGKTNRDADIEITKALDGFSEKIMPDNHEKYFGCMLPRLDDDTFKLRNEAQKNTPPTSFQEKLAAKKNLHARNETSPIVINCHPPQGEIGMITSANYPLALSSFGLTDALLAGNNVLFKMHQSTHGSAVILQQVIKESIHEWAVENQNTSWAKELTKATMERRFDEKNIVIAPESQAVKTLEDGLLQLTVGSKASFVTLSNGLYFIGGSQAGELFRDLRNKAKLRPPIVSLGGNSAITIMPSAVATPEDIAATLQDVVDSANKMAGQRCSKTRRLIVHKDANQLFIKGLVQHFHEEGKQMQEELASGTMLSPFNSAAPEQPDNSSHFPALMTKDQYTTMVARIEEAKSTGLVDVIIGGDRLNENGYTNAYTITPAMILWKAGAEDDDRVKNIMREETFAPLLHIVQKVPTLEKAIEINNDPTQQLSSAIYSKDPAELDYFVANCKTGMVEQNRPPKDARPDEPWGGNKDAGHYSKDGGKNSMARFTRDKEIRCNNLHEARDTIDRLGRIHAGFMHDNAFLPKDAIVQHYTTDIQKARSA